MDRGVALGRVVGELPVDVQELAAHFVVQLARFKQPRRIVLVADLPKTALGKVQKPRLQAVLAAAAGDTPCC